MPRLAWYAGVSTALAATVVVSAFHQRANFYSAMVYLAQSNFCLLVLVNFIYLIFGALMYGLQRVFYGPLRPVEVEQLSEKAWFAITETCLAMTIFREEIGAWFLVMFTALVTGKVWGWIGDGRVEVLEQQPPANPRLFHTRLSVSLLLSIAYDVWLLRYAVTTVIRQARPTMMVMFLFEFAVLAACSWRTGMRYVLSLVEARVVKIQTKQRLEERKRQVRQEREDAIRAREEAAASGAPIEENAEPLPSEDDVDEMDIEVPGWEAKGQWVLGLDLFTDFVKLAIYGAFFFILLTFYGLPIHIMRDLFMTTRSFIKRLGALLRYRRAVEGMNRYPDATEEELGREDTCIICREEMRPWDPTNNPGAVERSRPKKLPCGHILHYGCLKSWLERQQVCPTCRRPVVVDGPAAGQNREAVIARMVFGGQRGAQAQQQPGVNGAAVAPQDGQQQPRNGAVRMFNLGPIRLGFAQGENLQELAQRLAAPADGGNPPAVNPAPANTPADNRATSPRPQLNPAGGGLGPASARVEELHQMVRREVQAVQREVAAVQQALLNVHQEMQTYELLNAELNRIRQVQQHLEQGQNPQDLPPYRPFVPSVPLPPGPLMQIQLHQAAPQMGQMPRMSTVTRHGTTNSPALPAGSPDLPEGVVIPPGWSLLPLQRMDDAASQAFQMRVGEVTPVPIQAPVPVPAAVSVQGPATLTAEGNVTITNPIVASLLRTTQTPPSTGFTPAASPSPSRQLGSTGSNAAAEVAPTPTPNQTVDDAPNPFSSWASSSQMFGSAPRGTTLNNTSETTPAEAPEGKGANDSKTPALETGESSSSAPKLSEQSEEVSASAKDKGKAVTVEEAEDESD